MPAVVTIVVDVPDGPAPYHIEGRIPEATARQILRLISREVVVTDVRLVFTVGPVVNRI